MPDPRRREFDVSLELVTAPVGRSAYRVVSGTYEIDGGRDHRFDVYLPDPMPAGRPPTVILVHGDGPPEFLHEPRL